MSKQNKRHRKVRKFVAGPNFSGQHLMHNKQVIHELVERASITARDTVLEIGAGKGALTVPLAKKAETVYAVEYDPDFVAVLASKTAKYSNVQIIHKDIMNYSLPKHPFIVVANIPYSITTPILKKLLSQPKSHFQKGILVIEKGAAKRFTAHPVTNPTILKWRMCSI